MHALGMHKRVCDEAVGPRDIQLVQSLGFGERGGGGIVILACVVFAPPAMIGVRGREKGVGGDGSWESGSGLLQIICIQHRRDAMEAANASNDSN